MKDRIKMIRKNSNLNQTEFGSRIGVKQSAVTGYESGTRTPIDAIIISICREFNVREKWLRTGEGDMYNLPLDDRTTYISYLLENVEEPVSKLMFSILDAYMQLDNEKDKIVINNFIDSLLNKKSQD